MIVESSTFDEVTDFTRLSGYEALYVIDDLHLEQANIVLATAHAADRARRSALVAGAAISIASTLLLVTVVMRLGAEFVTFADTLRASRDVAIVPLLLVFAVSCLALIGMAVLVGRAEQTRRSCREFLAEIGRPLSLSGFQVRVQVSTPLALEIAEIQSDAALLMERLTELRQERLELQRFQSISSQGQSRLRRVNAQITTIERTQLRLGDRVANLLDPNPAARPDASVGSAHRQPMLTATAA